MTDKALNARTVREVLNYNPTTGILTRATRPQKYFKSIQRCNIWNAKHAGKVAGLVRHLGYVEVKLFDKTYVGHKLAWLHYYGEWPKDEIDHENHIRSDNRIDNMVAATRAKNAKNLTLQKRNKTGVSGVFFHQASGAWRVSIGETRDGKYLGSYRDFFEAVCVRKSAEIKHGYHPNHGAQKEAA